MRIVLLCILMTSMLSIVMGQTPLDLLQPRAAPIQSISLSGLSPTSALSIAGMNQNLTAWKDRPIADLGKYFSGNRAVENGMAGVPDVLINFSMSEGAMPRNISAGWGNLTPVETENRGMVFL